MKKDHYIFNLNKVKGDVLTLAQNLIQVQESDDIDNINIFLKVMENVCDPIFAKNIKVPKTSTLLIGKANRGLTKSVRLYEIDFIEK